MGRSMPTFIGLKKTTTENPHYRPAKEVIWSPDVHKNELVLVTEDGGVVATLDDEEIDALHQTLETYIKVRARLKRSR